MDIAVYANGHLECTLDGATVSIQGDTYEIKGNTVEVRNYAPFVIEINGSLCRVPSEDLARQEPVEGTFTIIYGEDPEEAITVIDPFMYRTIDSNSVIIRSHPIPPCDVSGT